MKITSLYAAMPNYDFGLGKISKIIYETLKELGIEVVEMNLAFSQIPYFDGIKSRAVEEIIESINQSSGVIFLTTCSLYSASPIIQTFIEHLQLDEYKNVFAQKNCMAVVASQTFGERFVLEYFSRLINFIGGNDTVKIGLNSQILSQIETNQSYREIIEKQVEDYYRAVKTNRRFFVPNDAPVIYSSNSSIAQPQPQLQYQNSADILTPTQNEMLQEAERRQKVPFKDVYKKLSLDSFTEVQEKDINEITKLFSKKIGEPEKSKTPQPVIMEPLQQKQRPVVARERTCRQLTQSLPHYFQPQLASGLNTTIQLSIGGADGFEAQLIINNAECTYYDGQANNPDITIITDCTIWTDIIKGKRTAQKAFMIGQLKVRGNFVILTKIEQLFKPVT